MLRQLQAGATIPSPSAIDDRGRGRRVWTFGDFRLDEAERQLTRAGMPIRLAPKAFDLLVVLVEGGGGLVRTHELMERLWPDTFVGNGTLARHVSCVRKALGDATPCRPLIQTVHKSGYRFQGRARESASAAGGAAARPARSLAVLPFRPRGERARDGVRVDAVLESDSTGHAFYLRGRYFWGRRTDAALRKALSYFDAALVRDPSCAAAHAARGDCLGLLAGYGVAPGVIAEARRAAERALAVDPESADAQVALALIAQKHDRDWEQAEARYQRALQLEPRHTTALQRRGELLASLGRLDDGLTLLERAWQREPACLILGSELAKGLFFARRYEESIRECRSVLDMDPTFSWARLYLGLSLLLRGDHEEGLSALLAFGRRDASPYARGIVAYASAVAGRPQAGRELLWALQHLRQVNYLTPYALALPHLGLGEHEAALEHLERLVEKGHDVLGLSVSPLMDPLREDRRFQGLLARAGLACPRPSPGL